jgi:RNA polymerase sigma factor (TIGR02999 family)
MNLLQTDVSGWSEHGNCPADRHFVPAAVTSLLRKWRAGDSQALDELVPAVYSELRRIARRYCSREAPGHTLQGTALVHEAYLRLIRQEPVDWQNRAQFFGVAARTMRRILIEHARRRGAEKRGGGAASSTLHDDALVDREANIDILLLDRALHELGALDPRRARVVEMRFFGGLTEAEIAAVLGVSEPTVRRDWMIAKAWLFRKMSGTMKPARHATGN